MITSSLFRIATLSGVAFPIVTAKPISASHDLSIRDAYPAVTHDNRDYYDLNALGTAMTQFDPSGVLWLDDWKGDVFDKDEDDDECRVVLL